MARREYQRDPVGECNCLECGRVAEVRENKNGGLYQVCLGGSERDGCGMSTPNTRHGQERLRARTRFFAVENPEPAPIVPEVIPPVPEPAKAPVPEKKRGLLKSFLESEL